MKHLLATLMPVTILAIVAALGTGCSDKGGPIAPNDPLVIDSVTVSSLSSVLSSSQYDFIQTGQRLTVTCGASGADNADLSTSWSANCGTFNRTDSCAVEWLAPDTGASAEIIVTVSDGHREAGDTLRLGIVSADTWEMTYNFGTYEDGQDVLRTAEGEYVVLVSHGSVRLVKLADDGTIIWSRYYGLGGSFWARSVIALADGGYAIVGGRRTLDGTAMLWDFFLLRVDADGNLMWQKVFENENAGLGYDVVATPDGGFFIVGSVDTRVEANHGVSLVRTDANGTTLWSKTYLGDRGMSIISTSDGGYVITGEMGVWCTGSSDIYLLMIDADGEIIRQPTFGDSDGELCPSVVETPGGGFAVAGQAYSATSGSTDAFLFITDHDFNLTKWTDFGGDEDDLTRDIVNRPQGGFAVAGYTESFGEGSWDMYLTAFDASGNFEWGKTFGGPELEEGQALVCTDDDGFVVVGRTMSFSADLCDLFVIKTDKNGRVSAHPQE